MAKEFESVGLEVPGILLPDAGTDMRKWAVVACDQYTSQPEYWQKAAEFVGEAPSTLKLMLPEVYLGSDREEEIIAAINRTMREYLEDCTLAPPRSGFVLVDRATSHAASRKGLVVALDLEAYDYNKGATTLIRATEGTILDRLPPRVRVRQDAPLELPHIMVLIDDPDRTVIEPLFEEDLPELYDFDLMFGSGHIAGRLVEDGRLQAQVAGALGTLADPARFRARYGVEDERPLLYAMGDGNHSFATAKAIWEDIKKAAGDPQSVMDHPARHALVELVNLHDPGLEFEPIHRVLFGADAADLFSAAESHYAAEGAELSVEWGEPASEPPEDAHAIPFVAGGQKGVMVVRNPARTLVVATLQEFLDTYLEARPDAEIDYIHGEGVVSELGGRAGNIGFFLPPIPKNDFFKTIVVDGALPRKTFSMGEADEKRFYLECRRIVK